VALNESETPLKQFYGVGAFELFAFGFFAFVPWTDFLEHTANKILSKEDHLRLLHLSSSRQHRRQRPLVGRHNNKIGREGKHKNTLRDTNSQGMLEQHI